MDLSQIMKICVLCFVNPTTHYISRQEEFQKAVLVVNFQIAFHLSLG